MSESRKTAAISLLVAAVLFILTAFSSADAWEQAAGETPAQMTETTEETSLETIEETLAQAQAQTLSETEPSPVDESDIETQETDATQTQAPEATASETGTAWTTASAEAASEGDDIRADASQETAPEEGTSGEAMSGETEADVEETTQAPVEETTEAPAQEAQAEVADYFANQFVATVSGKTALNVREEPDADSKWVGKMYEGSGGTILEVGDGWSKIESGNVTGWVSNDYILTGEAGKAAALEICELVFEVESDALKVRSAPTTEEENKLRAIYGGETYPVVSVEDNGWIEIEYKEGKTGWVAGQYGSIRYDYDTAMSRKEIQDAENAKKKKNVSTTSRESTSATTDETYLLACLINCESNHYEGQLAVANVVLNRVKSSRFPNSISDVIYAPGQFSPARSGKLAARLDKGPSDSAMRAAQDALNGTNNIGDYLYFRSAKTADVDAYASYTIVAGNCFYKR